MANGEQVKFRGTSSLFGGDRTPFSRLAQRRRIEENLAAPAPTFAAEPQGTFQAAAAPTAAPVIQPENIPTAPLASETANANLTNVDPRGIGGRVFGGQPFVADRELPAGLRGASRSGAVVSGGAAPSLDGFTTPAPSAVVPLTEGTTPTATTAPEVLGVGPLRVDDPTPALASQSSRSDFFTQPLEPVSSGFEVAPVDRFDVDTTRQGFARIRDLDAPGSAPLFTNLASEQAPQAAIAALVADVAGQEQFVEDPATGARIAPGREAATRAFLDERGVPTGGFRTAAGFTPAPVGEPATVGLGAAQVEADRFRPAAGDTPEQTRLNRLGARLAAAGPRGPRTFEEIYNSLGPVSTPAGLRAKAAQAQDIFAAEQNVATRATNEEIRQQEVGFRGREIAAEEQRADALTAQAQTQALRAITEANKKKTETTKFELDLPTVDQFTGEEQAGSVRIGGTKLPLSKADADASTALAESRLAQFREANPDSPLTSEELLSRIYEQSVRDVLTQRGLFGRGTETPAAPAP